MTAPTYQATVAWEPEQQMWSIHIPELESPTDDDDPAPDYRTVEDLADVRLVAQMMVARETGLRSGEFRVSLVVTSDDDLNGHVREKLRALFARPSPWDETEAKAAEKARRAEVDDEEAVYRAKRAAELALAAGYTVDMWNAYIDAGAPEWVAAYWAGLAARTTPLGL